MTGLFLAYLAGPARTASAIYILGDLFETWIGDDDIGSDFPARIVSALRATADDGTTISFLAGNRDFLIGDAFAAASGVRLLTEPYVLSTPEWQFVLAHGDALCTDDDAYQAFRRQVRHLDWQAAFLARPLAERRALAENMRDQSEHTKREKAAYLMDLNPGETDDFLRAHGYATFIHGHTHKPAQHDHLVDGIHVERWVLADWHENAGEYLAWNGERLTRHPVLANVA